MTMTAHREPLGYTKALVMLAEHFVDEDFDVTRDMDLVRGILLQIEESNFPLRSDDIISLSDDKAAEKHYLLRKMKAAGIITSNSCTALNSGITRHKDIELTWEGHDFLDAVRDPVIWSKTKEGAAAAGAFSWDILKKLAKGYAKKQIEEKTGIVIDI